MPGLVESLSMSWYSRDEPDSSLLRTAASLNRTSLPKILSSSIHCASWNISAVNNNPFEYWTSNPDPNYDSLMKKIQEFIENSELDVPINSIFLDSMFSELCGEMSAHQIEGLEKLKCYWTDDYSLRKAVKGFLKDKSIGTKRLASMPDRITNTINLHNGGLCLRPSVMNAYNGGPMSTLTEWWDQWKNFMFRTQVQVFTGLTDTSPDPQVVCSLITPILRGKYPAITEEEQAISVPLQILCLAILDAIFVHILNSVSGGTWEATRSSLCNALIIGKVPRVCDIIASSYSDCDVIFIQEAAAVFVQDAKRHADLQARYCTLAPKVLDGKRDQNSLILVSRERFDADTGDDVTQQVLDALGGAWVAPGDLLVVGIGEAGGRGGKWLLASFHGDSNGLSSQPLLLALREIADRDFEDHTLLLGIDANTTSAAAAPGDPTYPQSVHGFAAFLVEQELVSLWGSDPNPAAWTTCSSRTYIQTQLNKAVAFKDRYASSQRSLKDWIIASERQVLGVTDAARDNTGHRAFVDGTVLPTLEFPSDHAIVSAVFHLRPRPASDAGGVGVSSNPSGRKKARVSRPSRLRQTDGREKTLYDYWGIGQKPLAFERESTVGNGKQALRGEFANTLTYEEEVDKLVEEHYVRLVESRMLNDLDKQKREYSRSSDRSIWILFSTRPYTMAIRKVWFQVIVAVAGSAFFAQGALNMSSLYKVYVMRARGLRLTATTLRNGSVAMNAPVLAGLGLLQNGCRQVDVSETLWMSRTEMSVRFALSVPIDGFWIMTSDMTPEFDPGLYNLYRNLDDNSWQAVTPPPWVLQSRMFDVPVRRLKEKHVDLRPPVTWILSSCVGIPAFSIACYLSCFFGILGWGRRGAIAISGGFFFLALMQLIWALYTTVVLIADSEDGSFDSLNVNDTTAWTSWLFFICSIFLAGTAYKERYTLDSFLIVFTLIGAGMVYDAKDRATSSESGLYRASFALIWSILPAITLGILIMARFFTNRWVLNDFLSTDRNTYNKYWEKISASDSVARCLLGIRDFTDLINSRVEPGEARQYLGQISRAKSISASPRSFFSSSLNRKFSLQSSLRELVVGTTSCSSKFVVSGRTIVTSLDQLMEQAECLNIFLKQKVKDLALRTGGLLQVVSEGESRAFERFTESSQNTSHWVWAATKPAERALEKLLRSYNCDVSKLLDCCRQTIAYESASDLLKCLSIVKLDRDIEIVRIKNMLDVKFDSWRTGGFRTLLINLRIRSNETKKLGVDWHVCELQLNFREIVAAVTESAHSRFLVWRNCRDAPSLWRDGFILLKEGYANLQGYKKYLKPYPNDSNPQQMTLHSLRENHLVTSQETASNVLIGSPRLVFVAESEDADSEGEKYSESEENVSNGNHHHLHTNGNGTQSQLHGEKSLAEQVRKMMEEQHRISMTSDTRHDNYLSNGSFGKGKMVEIAVYRAADGSIWDTRYPFAALLCKRWFPQLLCFIILILLSTLAAYLSLSLQGNIVQGYRFRFTALALRNGQMVNSSGPGIVSLGFTKDSCGDDFQHLAFNKTVGRDGKLLISFAEPITMNGWWFETGNDSPEADPVSFTLERSTLSTGDDWELTGASSFTWAWSGAVKWDSGIYHTTTIRNATERFDLGVPWIWKIHRVSCSSAYLAIAISILFATATKHHLKAKWIAIILCFVTALMNGIACIFYCIWAQWQIGFVAGGCFLIDAALPVTLLVAERYLLFWIGAAGLGYPILNFVHYLVLLQMPRGLVGDRGIGFVRNFGLLEGSGYFCLFLFAHITRLKNRRDAMNIIKPDWDSYDACWTELNKQQAIQATLNDMHKFIMEFSCGCEHCDKILRQPMLLKFGPNGDASAISMQENFPREDGSLLHDLQRLFAQAAGVDIFLREKVKEWALVNRGCMRVKNSFERWEHILARKGESQVQWALLKSLDRALEKVYRIYSLDASRLLDCCRQSIYFQDAESLFRCLRTICADKEVKIARIRNRLYEGYDTALTAGYRDVLLNLSIVTDETQKLRLNGVICELQLSLIGFAAIKSEEGHARYVRWRNQRGQ